MRVLVRKKYELSLRAEAEFAVLLCHSFSLSRSLSFSLFLSLSLALSLSLSLSLSLPPFGDTDPHRTPLISRIRRPETLNSEP